MTETGAERSKRLYGLNVAAGICTKCAHAPAEVGKKCRACSEHARAHAAELRNQRKDRNQCPVCGEPLGTLEAGCMATCAKCLRRQRLAQAAYQARKNAKRPKKLPCTQADMDAIHAAIPGIVEEEQSVR